MTKISSSPFVHNKEASRAVSMEISAEAISVGGAAEARLFHNDDLTDRMSLYICWLENKYYELKKQQFVEPSNIWEAT